MFKITNNHKLGQAGVGMVEVLVALIVLSVGMLGVASMYVTTLQAKGTSLSRTKAVNLAYDMADRIRANPNAGAAYALLASATTTPTDCATVDCSATQLAASDLDQWDSMISDPITGLPGTVSRSIARTEAVVATAAPEFYTISLNWSEPSSGTLSFVLQVRI